MEYIYFGVLLFFLLVLFIVGAKKRKLDKISEKENPTVKSEDEILEKEFETEEVRATVVDMTCGTKFTGTKQAKSVREFIVSFETSDCRTLRLQVPEELYDGFEIGQSGVLTVVDGDLYSFTLDEQS